ncbi:MAG: hypothetical protein A3K19_11660 [Lentisphaerae bacterium RIFOXYB12_FULL_65_16]|nr:MAG: hypothetical protein A3K18_32425 [Lentisphaerae bacterium RIFOXYA12_64_32]OGV92414.1 MAG: hypothetical protein A3K19_11660 [Lentisphaerae bacterium RIFOXYB12_FULL_65_16]
MRLVQSGSPSPIPAWTTVLTAMLSAYCLGAVAAPNVFWASDPVRPGDTVMAFGAGFGAAPTIEVARLSDSSIGEPGDTALEWPRGGRDSAAIQPGDTAVKFTVPAALKPGIFAYRITGPDGAVVGILNRPTVWWAQGDVGVTARAGGWVRLFGKNLVREERPKTKVLLKGPKTVNLTPESADAYAAKVTLPPDLPTGEYQAFLHNGDGGNAAWSAPVKIVIENPPAWPQAVLNVKDFGADATGLADSTIAVHAALAKAQENGGGIVLFPRGRYQVSETLTLPRCTVVRGESQELTCVFWPDFDDPPKLLLTGTNSFGIEDISFYCSNYITFLSADTKGDDAGDVSLRRVRVRADIYRGHMKPEEVDRRYRVGLKVGFGGGYWLLVLGGRNVAVSDCDLYSSGCVLSLTQPKGARIENNILGSGRWGGGGVFGGDGVIMENNHYVGCDLMSWGAAGGLGFGNLSHVYLGHNTFFMENGGDREPITSDASGEVYHGLLAAADATTLTLPQPAKDTGPRWIGAAVYVVDGKGVGQWRKVAGFDGPTKVFVNPPWDVVPDATSTVSIVYLLHRWLVIDNEFTDTGMAVQFYGAALEHIAAGNRSSRTAGYHNFGMNYHGMQPSWFIQWFDNEILEGNIYRADHDNWRLSGDAHIGAYGLVGGDWKYPITLGTVMRRNHLHNNASIVLGSELGRTAGGRTDPLVSGVVVEGNTIENSDVGMHLFQTAHNVWMTGNQFRNVKLQVRDEVAVLKAEAERREKFLNSPNPMAVWDFEKVIADSAGVIRKVTDATGNGFDATGSGVCLAPDGLKGQAAKFAGQSYLRVEDQVMFNLQNVTLSLWIKPDTVKGRHGLIGKRYAGTAAPYILSLWDGGLEFEGTDADGKWSFNFRSAAAVKEGEWNHISVVVTQGKGVTIYCNGAVAGQKENAQEHLGNMEPLIIGRESWGGLPNQQDPPVFYQGLMDEVKLWARALTEDEIKALAAK